MSTHAKSDEERIQTRQTTGEDRHEADEMSRDSSFTSLHLHQAHHADLLEEFSRIKLPAEEIMVPPQHQPINPDDEDDVVPDQHAAFGIQRATQKVREPAWKDLDLDRLMTGAPPARNGESSRKPLR